MGPDDAIRYIVGQEKRLIDILHDSDVMPLLKAVVRAGASRAAVRDERGGVLWAVDGADASEPRVWEFILLLEGEPCGSAVLTGSQNEGCLWEAAGQILQTSLDCSVKSSLKRMLTTETHTTVMDISYLELKENNERLLASESRYRELSESLDRKVKERTEELRRAYAHMLQQEKLASVGQLAAGVAHEINNPLGFILSNLTTLERYTGRFREMLRLFQKATNDAALGDRWAELKMDYTLDDTTVLLRQTLEGARRAAKIVKDLRGFSHIDDGPSSSIDVNEEIERTMNVLRQTIPSDAKIEYDLQKIPLITANAALVSQVFCNLIQNALQARPVGLVLRVMTRCADGAVSIVIADNGPGIPDNIRERIFDPFFTTKEVGQGTGMGLTVVYEIMREHGGTVSAANGTAGGALFTVTFPTRENVHG